MAEEKIVVVNGVEVDPGKKVKLYKIKLAKDINKILKEKRQEIGVVHAEEEALSDS